MLYFMNASKWMLLCATHSQDISCCMLPLLYFSPSLHRVHQLMPLLAGYQTSAAQQSVIVVCFLLFKTGACTDSHTVTLQHGDILCYVFNIRISLSHLWQQGKDSSRNHLISRNVREYRRMWKLISKSRTFKSINQKLSMWSFAGEIVSVLLSNLTATPGDYYTSLRYNITTHLLTAQQHHAGTNAAESE